MAPTVVSADTETVIAAGNNTAATSDAWATIGSDVRTSLDGAKSALQDDPSGLGAAIETFASAWVPALTQLGDDVNNLGANATNAGVQLDNNDAQGSTTQTPPQVRPINAPVAV